MDLNELTDLVQESVEKLHEVGSKGSRVVVADKYKEELLTQHRRLVNCEPTTVFGLPLEFKDLPEEIIFIVESEVEE